MPYIKAKDRTKLDTHIRKLLEALVRDYASLDSQATKKFSPGELNYALSSIIWKIFDSFPSYTQGNNLIGVLECVKAEFYRRKLAPYEEQKMIENGDI